MHAQEHSCTLSITHLKLIFWRLKIGTSSSVWTSMKPLETYFWEKQSNIQNTLQKFHVILQKMQRTPDLSNRNSWSNGYCFVTIDTKTLQLQVNRIPIAVLPARHHRESGKGSNCLLNQRQLVHIDLVWTPSWFGRRLQCMMGIMMGFLCVPPYSDSKAVVLEPNMA